MSDASDQIDGIIQRALDLAAGKFADAGLYGDRASHAADLIVYQEGVADIVVPPHIILKTVNAEDLVVPDASTFQTEFQQTIDDTTNKLVDGFNDFFSHFADDLQGHDAAIEALTELAKVSTRGVDDLNARLGKDDQARAYLDSRMPTTAADARVAGSIEGGQAASGYLQGKTPSGNLATAYLIRKFSNGDQAATVLINMLTGGTVIPAAVENQIWQRDRARITAEAARTERQGIDQWAARGFPLPPGAVAMMSYITQKDAQDKIAQASRDVAIKQIDLLIENIRMGATKTLEDAAMAAKVSIDDAAGAAKIGVDDAAAAVRLTREDAMNAARILMEDSASAAKALIDAATRAAAPLVGLRNQALSASIDYMKALAIGPQAGADLARTVLDAKVRAAEVIARYFTARISADSAYNSAQIAVGELTMKPQLSNADNRARLHMAKGQTDIAVAQAKVSGAVGAATAAGNSAAAAIGTLNAIAALESA